MKDLAGSDILRVPYNEVQSTFKEILLRHGFSEERASLCASVFAGNSLEGVHTHGVNRFPKFINFVQGGHINIDATATRVHVSGSLEQWDGRGAPGIVNAFAGMDNAMRIADELGMGCVAMANTNHWMRAGTYSQYAAEKGYACIAWTNTIQNTPAWGAVTPKLGNNPLTIGVPYQPGPIVLDMAMSQYSYGALDLYRMKGEKLPFPGGYDAAGRLSDDPAAIMQTRRTLPIGYWKGSGLSLLLDILATVLSGGMSAAEISRQGAEKMVSQVFVAFNLSKLGNYSSIASRLHDLIVDFHAAEPAEAGRPARYPGERVHAMKAENLQHGIPVLPSVWEEIKAL